MERHVVEETMEENMRYSWKKLLQNPNALLFFLAFCKLCIHVAVNAAGGYGIFRDEFYYIACSDHLAWGYVDQPPFSIVVLWVSRLFFGDSLFAIRIVPALAGAVSVLLAGLIARELGGKRFAQGLAACSVLAAPLVSAIDSIFSMNSLDILFWSLAFYLLVLIIKENKERYWILLGIVLGLGLLNKISVLWLSAGIFAGLLLTPNRKLLLTRRIWIAAAIALLLFLPHILWEAAYGFPTLEFIKNASTNKYTAIAPLDFFIQQMMNMNPFALPIWISGLMGLLFITSFKRYRILPIIYFSVVAILLINRTSKTEYLAPMIPMLFAAGAVVVETFIGAKRIWLKSLILSLLVLSGMMIVPLALPILPVERYIAYTQRLGVAPSTPEKKEIGKLPQFYADMFGWESMVSGIANAFKLLTPEEQKECAILGNNYGEAGAIDYYGVKYGLPKAISGHNNYWLWGPRNASGAVVIRIGGSPKAMKASYREVDSAGIFQNPYCMPYENNQTIWICKHRVALLKDDWQRFKHYE